MHAAAAVYVRGIAHAGCHLYCERFVIPIYAFQFPLPPSPSAIYVTDFNRADVLRALTYFLYIMMHRSMISLYHVDVCYSLAFTQT